MAADLRTRLKALVGELHQQAALYRRGQELFDERQALAYTQVARKLAALLAESEPEPVDWSRPHDLLITVTEPVCSECGESHAPGCEPPKLKLGHPDCAAKAKLPLADHAFVPCPGMDCEWRGHSERWEGGGPRTRPVTDCHRPGCGQPREAH